MLLNGKKIRRIKMMRVTEVMWQQINVLAQQDGRTLQDQTRWLMACAISQALLRIGNGTMGHDRHLASTDLETLAPAPPMSTGVNSGKLSSRKTA